MLRRSRHEGHVLGLLKANPVVAILGARQVGKTTLARHVAARWKSSTSWFDLEDPADESRLSEPMLALRDLKGLVVLDEVQRHPNLFPALRVLADQAGSKTRYLVLGSASPSLLRQSSESLAGRIAYHTLPGFSLEEAGPRSLSRLWLRGGFPRSFLARNDSQSASWRREFVRTFLERDIPQFGITIPSTTLRRFWTMLAHYHGQIWNSSAFAGSFGVADTTIRRYLDVLTQTLVVRQLLPWHENLSKRQVKSPKVYMADSGLLHTLLGIDTLQALDVDPKLGSSWEGFALDQVVQTLEARPEECYFWATHAGAELDLLVVRGHVRRGFEFKRSEAPKLTPSMAIAMKDLKLDRLEIIHAGKKSFPVAEHIQAVPLERIGADLGRLPHSRPKT